MIIAISAIYGASTSMVRSAHKLPKYIPNVNGGLITPPLELEYGQVITYHVPGGCDYLTR